LKNNKELFITALSLLLLHKNLNNQCIKITTV